jgi:predicted unusual protein kinase regulating ubiquinone biosynthesis (AarF/ABC1/UbiB family)
MADSDKKRTLKSLKTGTWERGFKLAKSYVGTGSRLLGQKVATSFLGKEAADHEMFQSFLKELTKFTVQIGELKGSFQKVGQMLAMFGDQFLPPEALKILSALQSDSPSLSWEPIEKTLREELPAEKYDELEIEHEAIGAASLGQVHRARVKKTGEILALKIQYPGIARATDSDLKILKRILGLMNWIPRGPQMDDLFTEVQTMLVQELDYRQELFFFQRLGKLIDQDVRYQVPKVYPEYSSGRVLAMSYEEGLAADSAEVLSWSQADRNKIGELWLELYLKEIFRFGFVQTDPHFGNYKIRKNASGEIQLVLLDFGATRGLVNPFWNGYREMLVGTYQHDQARVVAGALDMKFLREEDSPELQDIFYRLCCLVAEPFLINTDYKFHESDLPKRSARLATEMVIKFKVRPPPRELVFLDRKMAGTFLFLSRLKCEFNPRPFVQREVAIYLELAPLTVDGGTQN